MNFRCLLATSMIGMVATLASPALAQDQGARPDAAAAAPTDVVVTGSRLAQPNLTSTSPLQIVSAQELHDTGTINSEQLLNTLPQLVPSISGYSNNNAAGIVGAAQLNLRNLGPSRTLVLVDGRRYVSYSPDGTVDINTIATDLVERIDIITGGASAVYGSDAIAGVVNYVLKKNFSGVQLDANGGFAPSAGDARRYSIGLTLGTNFADGRGNVTIYGNYTQRDALAACDRAVSCPILSDSGTSLVSNYNANSGTAIIDNFSGSPFATGSAGTAFSPDGSFHAATNADKYQAAVDQYLLTPQKRWGFSALGQYEFSSHLTLFASAHYQDNSVQQRLGPAQLAIQGAVLQVNSPYFNAATRAALANLDASQTGVLNGIQQTANDGYVTIPGNLRRRLVELGSRYYHTSRQAAEFNIGLRGQIDSNWKYEIGASYAHSAFSTIFTDASRSRYLAALDTDFAANGTLECRSAAFRAIGCVPANIFGPGQLSAAALNYISAQLHSVGSTSRQDATAFVSGKLFDLGAGPAGLVVGGEIRKESADLEPDQLSVSGDSFASQTTATKGSYNVKEAFTEVRIPLLKGLPLIDSLSIHSAARYSDYSLKAVGGVWAYAAGLEYRPVSDLLIRAEYQRAVRAPNILELDSGILSNAVTYSDPCSNKTPVAQRTAALQALCVATGVPSSMVFTAGVQPNATGFVQGGGNPLLKEETSDTYTVGAVFTPGWIPRLHMSLDYYNIAINSVIGQSGGGGPGVLNLCYNVLQDASSSYCQQVQRVAGVINTIVAVNANLGILKRDGLDFQLDYSVPLNFGFDHGSKLRFGYTAGYVLKAIKVPIVDQPSIIYNCLGSFGNTACGEPDPQFKSSFDVRWESGLLSVGVKWRHISAVLDDRVKATSAVTDPSLLAVPSIPAYDYFDLNASYKFGKVKLTVGLDNVFGRNPPLLGSGSYTSSNTWPATYDVLGRYLRFGVSTKF